MCTPLPRSRSTHVGTRFSYTQTPATASLTVTVTVKKSRPAGLLLVRVPVVPDQKIGEGHPHRVVLHLPDVTELVRDELDVGEQRPRPQQNRPVGRVALKAAEPRQPEEPRHDPDPNAAQRDRLRVERAPVEPLLRTRERVTLRLVHEPTL